MESLKRKKILLLFSFYAGLLAVFIFRRNLSAEAAMVNYFGFISKELISETATVTSIREMFRIPVVGFIHYDFFDIVNISLLSILFAPVLLFCYKKRRWIGILGAFLLVSCLSMYIISNTALSLFGNLHNSDKLTYILNNFPQKAVLNDISIFLLYLFGLFITIASRNLGHFSKHTCIWGLLTNIIGLLYFPLELFIGDLRFIAIVLSAPFTVIWHMNIAININNIRNNLNLDLQRSPGYPSNKE